MKNPNHLTNSYRTCLWAALAVLAFTAAELANASTLAYWRFEGDGVSTPVAGSTQVEDTDGRTTTTTGVGIRVVDVSGNGNTVWAWDHAWAGHTYQSLVPAATVPLTGAANNFSVQNAGSYPAMFTWSSNSSPTLDVEPIKPLGWTIEASINATANDGNRTFVGRDGTGVATNGGWLGWAPLYFQSRGGTLWIQFTDMGGNTYQLQDTNGAMLLNTWYNVAAVSDGTTLSLYRGSGGGYQLVGSMGLTAGDTRLAYDDVGSDTPGDTQWGWTLGRARASTARGQGDGHVDRWFGYIDEVRISDSALDPSQFLFVPEPGTLALVVVGGALLFWQRRKACA